MLIKYVINSQSGPELETFLFWERENAKIIN